MPIVCNYFFLCIIKFEYYITTVKNARYCFIFFPSLFKLFLELTQFTIPPIQTPFFLERDAKNKRFHDCFLKRLRV